MKDNLDMLKNLEGMGDLSKGAPLMNMILSYKILQVDLDEFIKLKGNAVKEKVRRDLISAGASEAEVEQRIEMDKDYLRWNVEKLGTLTALDNIKASLGVLTCVVFHDLNIEKAASLIQDMSIEHTGNTFMNSLESKDELYQEYKEEFNNTCVGEMKVDEDEIIVAVTNWIIENVMATANIDEDELASLQEEEEVMGDA